MRASYSQKDELHNQGDKKISIALMAPFVILTLQYFILIFFNILGTTTATTVQSLSKILVGIIYVSALPIMIKRSKGKLILAYYTAIFIFGINYIIFPDNSTYLIELIFPFFFMSLPALILALSLRNLEELKKIMNISGLIIFILGTILGVLIFSGNASVGTYSMSLSYYMLIPAIIYLDDLLDNFSLKSLFFTVVSFLIILVLGSRGAILCILFFVFLRLLRFDQKASFVRKFYHLNLLVILSFVFIYSTLFLESLNNYLGTFGLKSRSISLFLNNEIHLSGRDIIYGNIVREVLEAPVIGIGIAGDRAINGGGYVHNIFIEVIGNFGVIFGSILVIAFSLLVIINLLTKDHMKFRMILIWISIGLIHLFISSSYLTDIKFWILLGLLIGFILNKQKRLKLL